MGGKNRAPPRQIAHLAKSRTGSARQGRFNTRRQGSGHRREIDNCSGDPCGTGHDVGTEDRQIEAGVREPDAVENLQTPTEPRQFQVDLAYTAATQQLVANEQVIPFQLPLNA